MSSVLVNPLKKKNEAVEDIGLNSLNKFLSIFLVVSLASFCVFQLVESFLSVHYFSFLPFQWLLAQL